MSIAAQVPANGFSGAGAPLHALVRRILIDRRRTVAGYRLVGGLRAEPAAGAAGAVSLQLPELPHASAGLGPSHRPNFLRCRGDELAGLIGSNGGPELARVVLEMQPGPDTQDMGAHFDLALVLVVITAG